MAFFGRFVDNIPARILVSCTMIGHYAKYYFEENFVIGRADRGATFRSQMGNTH